MKAHRPLVIYFGTLVEVSICQMHRKYLRTTPVGMGNLTARISKNAVSSGSMGMTRHWVGAWENGTLGRSMGKASLIVKR